MYLMSFLLKIPIFIVAATTFLKHLVDHLAKKKVPDALTYEELQYLEEGIEAAHLHTQVRCCCQLYKYSSALSRAPCIMMFTHHFIEGDESNIVGQHEI